MKKSWILIVAIALIVTTAAMLGACKPMFRTDVDYKVGVSQFLEHGALKEAGDGFTEELNRLMTEAGKSVDVVTRVAQGDQSNCTTIANAFVANKADLVLGIATPSAKALTAAAKDKNIPVLFSAVTDAVDAGMVASNEHPGGNVTGTSDINPIEKQIRLIKRLYEGQPSNAGKTLSKIGILYCNAEKNSIVQRDLAKTVCAEMGVELVEGGVNDANEIKSRFAKLRDCDAISVPTDNIIANAIEHVNTENIGSGYKKIIVCAENIPNMKAGIATYGVDYKLLGKMAAQMAFDILVNGKNPGDIPVQNLLASAPLTINLDKAQELGITIPDEVMAEYRAQAE